MHNNRLLFLMLSVVCLSLLSSSSVLAADTIAQCGVVNNVPTVSAPANNLCASGVSDFVTKHKDYYMWKCYGSNASISTDDSQCSAPIIGVCGTASATSVNPPTSNLCKEGKPVNMNWLDGAYMYRKPMILANYSNVVLSDYTFNIKVDFASGMQANFNDIRFTGADGKTQLSYWIESKTDGVSANVWVRMPNIPLNGSIMYMYYGNSSVQAGSNGHDTFVFFDDFDSALDNVIWGAISNALPAYNSGGALFLDKSPKTYGYISGGRGVATNVRVPLYSDLIIDTKFYSVRNVWMLSAATDKKYPASVTSLGVNYWYFGDDLSLYQSMMGSWALSNTRLYASDSGGYQIAYNTMDYDGWQRLTSKISYSNKTVQSILARGDGTHIASGSVSNPLKNPFIQISAGIRGNNCFNTVVDWVTVRKNHNITTEPFVVFGAAQSITSSNSGPWEWYCYAGALSKKCSTQVVGVDGKCGTAAKTYVATDTNFVGPFCESGTNIPSNIVFPGVGKTVSWKCSGTGGGKEVTCSANVDILEFDSELVTHTIPASILPEETIKNVTVTMKNTGSVTWNKAANIKLGALGDASLFGPSRLELPAGVSVATGQQHVFKFDIKAPKTSKAYNIRYKMVKD